MERTRFGRTGFSVSRMGVGAGGPSRAGQSTGRSEAESVDLLVKAFENGVNLVDTAEGYGTEEIVGKALARFGRDGIVVSTKKSTRHKEVTPATVSAGLDESLRKLGTDVIDVYNLHGVVPQDYRRFVEDVYPTLQKAQETGKVRFLGLSEMFGEDRQHEMLGMALEDDLWDVLMVGFNLLNQTARERVFARAQQQDVGIQIMFAVRKALTSEEALAPFLEALVASGEVDAADLAGGDAIRQILSEGTSLPDIAYRFCRQEPGVHAVLSGTGSAAHLEANLQTFRSPRLPDETAAHLRHLFRNVISTTGHSVE